MEKALKIEKLIKKIEKNNDVENNKIRIKEILPEIEGEYLIDFIIQSNSIGIEGKKIVIDMGVESGDIDLNKQLEIYGGSIITFLLARIYNNKEIIFYFIEKNYVDFTKVTNIDCRDISTFAMLIKTQNTDIINYCVKNNKFVNLSPEFLKKEIIFLLQNYYLSEETIDLIFSSGLIRKEDLENEDFLFNMVTSNNGIIYNLKAIISKGVKLPFYAKNSEGETVLHIAAKNYRKSFIDFLFELDDKTKIALNVKDNSGKKPSDYFDQAEGIREKRIVESLKKFDEIGENIDVSDQSSANFDDKTDPEDGYIPRDQQNQEESTNLFKAINDEMDEIFLLLGIDDTSGCLPEKPSTPAVITTTEIENNGSISKGIQSLPKAGNPQYPSSKNPLTSNEVKTPSNTPFKVHEVHYPYSQSKRKQSVLARTGKNLITSGKTRPVFPANTRF